MTPERGTARQSREVHLRPRFDEDTNRFGEGNHDMTAVRLGDIVLTHRNGWRGGTRDERAVSSLICTAPITQLKLYNSTLI